MLPYYKYNTLGAGIDEVTRGTLIADVYAGAVILPMLVYREVMDSIIQLLLHLY